MKDNLKNFASLTKDFSLALQDEPLWLQKIKKKLWEKFLENGLPQTSLEDWKYTNLNTITRKPIRLSTRPNTQLKDKFLSELSLYDESTQDETKAVLLNGHVLESSWNNKELEEGVSLKALRQEINNNSQLIQDFLAKETLQDSVDQLNGALASDGITLCLEKNISAEKPINLFFYAQENQEEKDIEASFLKNIIHLKAGSRAKIFVHFGSFSPSHLPDKMEINLLHNIHSTIFLEQGANLELYLVQNESYKTCHLSSFQIHQDKDSCLKAFTLSSGACLGRQAVSVFQDGTHAESFLSGLAIAKGKQHQDFQTKLNHLVPEGKSHQYFKALAKDHATAVYGGGIKIKQDAQKIKAYQLSKNLLLSEKAQAHTKPQLEIDADDVKCTHGATIGPLREDEIFYLQARGISKAKAESMLAYSFSQEVFSSITDAPMKQYFSRQIQLALQVPINEEHKREL